MWGGGTVGIRRGVAGGASGHHSRGAIVVVGAVEVGARLLIVGSLLESISVSDFTTLQLF